MRTSRERLKSAWSALEARGATVNRVPDDALDDVLAAVLAYEAEARLRVLRSNEARRFWYRSPYPPTPWPERTPTP